MNPDKQRIAIAEACGWTQIRLENEHDPNKDRSVYLAGKMVGWAFGAEVPDYLRDLNAIHEAEKTLTLDQKIQYDKHLAEHPNVGFTWGTTAAQRAEAFLRTIGRWNENE